MKCDHQKRCFKIIIFHHVNLSIFITCSIGLLKNGAGLGICTQFSDEAVIAPPVEWICNPSRQLLRQTGFDNQSIDLSRFKDVGKIGVQFVRILQNFTEPREFSYSFLSLFSNVGRRMWIIFTRSK